GQDGSEETQVGVELRILGHGATTPHGGLVEITAGVTGKAQGSVRIEQMGIEGGQPDADLRAALALRGLADIGVRGAASDPSKRRIRAGGEGAVEERKRPRVIVKDERSDVTAERERARIEWIALQRRLGIPAGLLEVGAQVGRPTLVGANAV